MRITTKDAPQPAFNPVVIEITCETKDELDAIATIFECQEIDDACAEIWPSLKNTVFAIGRVDHKRAHVKNVTFRTQLQNQFK